MDIQDKYKGMIVGAILGDALGVPIEFLSHQEIIKQYGNGCNYTSQFLKLANHVTSDETFLLTQSLKFFSQGGRGYESFLGSLWTNDDDLRKRGISRKMRNLIEQYSVDVERTNPFSHNPGSGFLPLVLPYICTATSKDAFNENLNGYIHKTHSIADPMWVKTYFSVLNGLCKNLSMYGGLGQPILDSNNDDKLLAQALCGNIESITTVSGSSGQILPIAIMLYMASHHEFETMVEIAIKSFSTADYDTLFFATGALIGASVGYQQLPTHLLEKVRNIEAILEAVDLFVSQCDNDSQPIDTRVCKTGSDDLKRWVSQDLDAMVRSKETLFNLVPEMRLQDGYDSMQPRHHLPLLDHTLQTVNALSTDDVILRCAGLLHDIAKPFTREKKENRVTYHNHAKTGSRMAYETCYRLGFPIEEVETIRHLIAEHVVNYTSEWTSASVRRFKVRNEKILPSLFTLLDADNKAQRPSNSSLDELKGRVNSI